MDHSRLRFAEFVRMAHPQTLQGGLAWVLVKLGWLKLPRPIIPRKDPLREHCVALSDLPKKARDQIEAVLPEIQRLGYVEPVFECRESTTASGDQLTAIALRSRHGSGLNILQSLHGCSKTGVFKSYDQLMSILSDGRAIVTSGGRREIDPTPQITATYHPGVSVEELMKLHAEKFAGRFEVPRTLRSNDEMFDCLETLNDNYFTHMEKRGVLIEVDSPADDVDRG